jgi:hypothetical protein
MHKLKLAAGGYVSFDRQSLRDISRFIDTRHRRDRDRLDTNLHGISGKISSRGRDICQSNAGCSGSCVSNLS